MSVYNWTIKRSRRQKNAVTACALIAGALVIYSTKLTISWGYHSTSSKSEWKEKAFLPLATSEYMDLHNFATDLKNHWFLASYALREENVTRRRMGVIRESYRVLQRQVADFIKRYTPGAERASRKIHQNEASVVSFTPVARALSNMSSIVESVWMKEKVPQSAFEAINSLYRSIQSTLLKKFNASRQSRERILDDMARVVQDKIDRLQNPDDCSTARLQVCEVVDVCGYGCQLHWVTNCMMDAFERERTVVYRTKGWLYSEQMGWDYAFQPVGKCTLDGFFWRIPGWFGNDRITRWRRRDRTEEVSYTIPMQLASSLLADHEHPNVWWISRFVSHLTKYQPWMQEKIDKLSGEFGFGLGPITGVHIRRGDKIGIEAARFEVEDYMYFVEQWYLLHEATHEVVKRTVFVATDDSTVLPELKSKYPDYNFIHNVENVTSYDEGGLESIVMDVHFLSRSDFVVCTFTSNVCRLVYEVMTTLKADASLRIQSLDDAYYFTSSRIPMRAIADHNVATNGGDLKIVAGDLLEMKVNAYYQNATGVLDREDFLAYNDGFFHGSNTRTSELGRFPTYKSRRTFRAKNYTIFN